MTDPKILKRRGYFITNAHYEMEMPKRYIRVRGHVEKNSEVNMEGRPDRLFPFEPAISCWIQASTKWISSILRFCIATNSLSAGTPGGGGELTQN